MSHWLLQANPKTWRVFDFIADGHHIETFTVGRYLDEVTAGDEAVLWVSGINAGVYAMGVVTGPVAHTSDGVADQYWSDTDAGNAARWRAPIQLTSSFFDTPVLKADLIEDGRFTNAAILRQPWAASPFRLTSEEWKAIRDLSPRQHGGSRNPDWAWDELILALDLYLRRRPTLPGSDHPEVVALSGLLNDLPIHTVRPDLETFRNPNGVALKLANFAALDPQYPGKGMQSVSRRDVEVWDRYASDPGELGTVVAAIRAGASGDGQFPVVPEEDEDQFEEGRLLYRQHRSRERNSAVVRKKKATVFKATGHLRCEVCGFDFAQSYGVLGEGYIEGHHVQPLSHTGETKTTQRDIALVCPNCHRMLHRARPWLYPTQLRERLNPE